MPAARRAPGPRPEMRSPEPAARASAASTWDRHAARYARQVRWEDRAVATALALARPRPADRVLDVATGTGVVLAALAALPQPPRSVTAIDRSPGMLARLPPPPPGWTVRQADAGALPLAGGSVDLATVSYLLQLLGTAARAAVLAELHRVLAPGGRVVTVTPFVARRGGGRAAAAALRTAAALAPGRLGGLRPHDPRAELDAAGFRVAAAATRRHGYPSLVVLARRR